MTKRLTIAALGLVFALALGLTGCGRDGSDGDGVATAGGRARSSAPATKENAQDKMRRFAQCMRDQGIDMPDPKRAEEGEGGVIFELPEGEPGGSPPDREKVEAAHKKCGHLLPDGGDLPKPDAATVEQMRKFAKCMRENGISNFPDPDANGRTPLGPDSGFDPRDPKFAEAQKKCQEFAPKGPAGAPGPAVGVNGG